MPRRPIPGYANAGAVALVALVVLCAEATASASGPSCDGLLVQSTTAVKKKQYRAAEITLQQAERACAADPESVAVVHRGLAIVYDSWARDTDVTADADAFSRLRNAIEHYQKYLRAHREGLGAAAPDADGVTDRIGALVALVVDLGKVRDIDVRLEPTSTVICTTYQVPQGASGIYAFPLVVLYCDLQDGPRPPVACEPFDLNDVPAKAVVRFEIDPRSGACRRSVDEDRDGLVGTLDNCPKVANTDQEDADRDGEGDACDPDDDNDGLVDARDNCPLVPNPDQADVDHNGFGDLCERMEPIPSGSWWARHWKAGVGITALGLGAASIVTGGILNYTWNNQYGEGTKPFNTRNGALNGLYFGGIGAAAIGTSLVLWDVFEDKGDGDDDGRPTVHVTFGPGDGAGLGLLGTF